MVVVYITSISPSQDQSGISGKISLACGKAAPVGASQPGSTVTQACFLPCAHSTSGIEQNLSVVIRMGRTNGERLPFRPRQAWSGVFASAKVYRFSLPEQCIFLTSIEVDLIIARGNGSAPRILGKS